MSAIIGYVRVKPGVQFTVIAPAGFRLLSAIEWAARTMGVDLTITSACDGVHSGPNDPHHRGEAYDVRTHGLSPSQVADALDLILQACRGDDDPTPAPNPAVPHSLETATFFGFLEEPGTDTEHLHVQLRQGASYAA